MDLEFLENKDRVTVEALPTFMTEVEGEVTGELNLTNETVGMQSFIFTPYAFTISGFFVWSALLLTCFQVRVYPLMPRCS
jgi:hypothetical protein